MEKPKYKNNENNKSSLKILILLSIILVILVILSTVLKYLTSKETTTEISYDNLSTIKEVIEYYKSIYISEEESTDSNFYLDVFLKFKVLPYENNESNEEYYNKLLEDSAKILNYRSFRMFDEENNITVQVKCDNSKINSIIINDIEDYFIYMDSQLSLEKYKEIPITTFDIQSKTLKDCIDNNWNSDTYIGERDSIFDEYYIYFDEGIKVRTIGEKIYNIVFDKKYDENVVNGIFPGVDFDYIELTLGKATFKEKDTSVIGYKGEDIYVFFTPNEISIYRNSKESADDFFDLADKFLNEELDLLEFMNKLTYMWPDYSDYEYDATYVFISYPIKGIEIRLNYDDLNGIMLYNNVKSNLTKISKYLDNTNFVARLQIDLIYETEKRRVKGEENLLEKCKEYKETLSQDDIKIIGESLDYDIYPETDSNGAIYSMKFISKFNEEPNRELNDNITSYLWLSNDRFLYSKDGKGIYLYSLNDGKVKRIISGSEEYNLKGIEDGLLKYDETEMQINF